MLDNQTEALKEKYLKYYRDCPIQKYAAWHIGRVEETIVNWKRKDPDFASKIDAAKASWVKMKLKKANVEWALERLEKEVFSDPDKARDLVYEQFKQFIFIFTLSQSDLRRFVQSGLARAGIRDNSDSAGAPQSLGEGEEGGAVDAAPVSE